MNNFSAQNITWGILILKTFITYLMSFIWTAYIYRASPCSENLGKPSLSASFSSCLECGLNAWRCGSCLVTMKQQAYKHTNWKGTKSCH